MNIFALHINPRICAQWHSDKHVVKMLLETCQLLYSVWHIMSSTVPSHAYKLSHKNHPCAIWARQTTGNYQWLSALGIELAKEYTHRYKKIHKCQAHAIWLWQNIPPNLPNAHLQTFAIAMADVFKISKDPIECYKNYYCTSKQFRGITSYTAREKPDWLYTPIDVRSHFMRLGN
jgi:hypothetical protein